MFHDTCFALLTKGEEVYSSGICVCCYFKINSFCSIVGFESDDPYAGAYQVQTTVVHTGNSILNGKEYKLPSIVWQTNYLDNSGYRACSKRVQPNLYNDPGCKKQFDKVIYCFFRRINPFYFCLYSSANQSMR